MRHSDKITRAIASALVTDEALDRALELLADPDLDLADFVGDRPIFTVRTWPQLFATTAGPFRGRIAGQGFMTYQITVFTEGQQDEIALVFAGDRFFGVTPSLSAKLWDQIKESHIDFDHLTDADLIRA